MISTYSLALSVDIPEPQRMDVSVGVEVGPSCCGALSKTFWVEVSTSCCGTHFFSFTITGKDSHASCMTGSV